MRTFVPLLAWLEQNKAVPVGTVKKINDFADNVKQLGDALKAGGILK